LQITSYRRSLKPSREHSALPKIKFINFFLCLWVIFALLDPDPDRETGSGPRDPIESGSTALLGGFDVFVCEGKDGVERIGERHELGLQLQVLLRPLSGRRGMATLLLLLYFKYSWQLCLRTVT
jgi:hypothetical protein